MNENLDGWVDGNGVVHVYLLYHVRCTQSMKSPTVNLMQSQTFQVLTALLEIRFSLTLLKGHFIYCSQKCKTPHYILY